MNILFGALFIIILILPGIIFQVSYLNIPYARKSFKSSFIDELLFSRVSAHDNMKLTAEKMSICK